MIASINFGGLSKPATKTTPLVAPTPAELKQFPEDTIKNHGPKPQ